MNTKKLRAIVNENRCVACGCCAAACPLSAIQIKDGSFAIVNYEKCVGCKKCSNICPASVIKMEVCK